MSAGVVICSNKIYEYMINLVPDYYNDLRITNGRFNIGFNHHDTDLKARQCNDPLRAAKLSE